MDKNKQEINLFFKNNIVWLLEDRISHTQAFRLAEFIMAHMKKNSKSEYQKKNLVKTQFPS